MKIDTIPHISFRYDGRDSDELLPEWKTEVSTEINTRGELTHTTAVDPATGLKVMVHIQRFDGFPAVDWVVEFENCGSVDTPIIECILPMDVSVPMPSQERLRLHHANGSAGRMDDFLPLSTDLHPDSKKTLAPWVGRSSNGTLPFMNFQRKGCGLVLAIGWSGQWAVTLERNNGAIRIAAGMERTRLRLHPGERIRTPRILLLTWEGEDAAMGNNLLRRILAAHYLPRIDGQLVLPPVAQFLPSLDERSERCEQAALPKAAAIGAEAYWIDAGWYGGNGGWYKEAGSWVVNRNKFPGGLKPI